MSEHSPIESHNGENGLQDTAEPQIDPSALVDAPPPNGPKSKTITKEDVVSAILKGHKENSSEEDKADCSNTIKKFLQQIAQENSCYKDYNIIVLFDTGTLVKSDADRIYNAITRFQEKKPLLLILYSNGGLAESAYLIGKLCSDYSNGKFVIAVPRMAKSAATLICCAADEIHMGSLSELGPIDPQINDLPALGLKYSVEHIAELVKRYPASSDMFAKYLNSSLPLINLGYYERVAESAMQYAEKLLSTHENKLVKAPKDIARELVYKYKDHSFVIDKSEGEEIFGDEIVKSNTSEYELGNGIYGALSYIERIADIMGYNFYFTGSFDSDPSFMKKRRRE